MADVERAVPAQLERVCEALDRKDGASFSAHVLAFVHSWQSEREKMESNDVFVHPALMQKLPDAITDSERSWYALKLGCLMARADANALSLLRAGGVAAVIGTLRADWPDESLSRVEVALALLQNLAYSNEGVTTILHNRTQSDMLPDMTGHDRT
jgi:hypothetical protein